MYAVTGATGQLGRLVIAALKERGKADQTLALARDPAKADDLGVTVRAFDYDKPDDLASALSGVSRLLLISSSEVGKRARQHANVIAAAKAAGVKQIVYTSLLNADTSPLSLAPEHQETEKALKQSGLDYVILRNGWYTENYTGSLGAALANGAIAGSTGKGKVTTASRFDLAEAAAIVLTTDGHSNKTYELGNDEPYSLDDLADELSKQSGKPVKFVNLDWKDYADTLEGFGLPRPAAEMIAQSDDHASRGALYNDSGDLGRLLGRPTQSLSEAVAKALKSA